MLMFDVCVSLKPQTPSFVNTISQTIKKDAVIHNEGNRYLNFEAYLNRLSHEARSGNDNVKSNSLKYRVT